MKKGLLATVFIFMIVITAIAQPQFGIKAGVNLADQSKKMRLPQGATIKEDTKPMVGYHLGVFYKKRVKERMTLSVETNFSLIGSAITYFTPDGKSYDATEKIGFIELPVTIQYNIDKLYFGVGPGVGYRLFSKLTNFENRSWDITIYRNLDVAGNLLAGYKASKNFDLNLRYSHGLMNIYKNPGSSVAKNKFVSLSFLYSLK